MKYNFDEAVERRGTGCLKYDFAKERGKKEDVLPLWVADMDFRTPECVTDALHRRVAHGAYGYAYIPESYYETCFNWLESRYGFRPKKESPSRGRCIRFWSGFPSKNPIF